jgi:sigma-B regulation protein RsbU (phosphoserine phosphatase)
MITAPSAADETERLTDLRALEVLDTPSEERFDRIIRLAKGVFHVPIAYIALIDSDRQWFKAKCGIDVDQTGREISFCGHTIMQDEALIVPDATQDERFWDNPLVVGKPYIRFYAGYPLKGPKGFKVGTFCVADRRPRTFDDGQREIFSQLAALAEHELQMVSLIYFQHELLETKNALLHTSQRLARELADAAEYVQSLLPARLDGPIRTDWRFLSSSQLGGDLFGYHWLDERRLAIYLFDVCGHGVGAALLSIAIHTALRGETLPHARFDRPAEVLAGLNQAFPMEQNNNKFFTLWYGVYDRDTRVLRYATGGHPPALVVNGHADPPVKLGEASPMVGVLPEANYQEKTHEVQPGSRLYVYSDGVFEVTRGPDGRMLMLDGLIDLLTAAPADNSSRVEHTLQHIQALHGGSQFNDDFSLLEIEFGA